MQIWGIFWARGVVYGTHLTGREGQWPGEDVEEEKVPAWPCEVLMWTGLNVLAAELRVSAGKRQSCPVITWQ